MWSLLRQAVIAIGICTLAAADVPVERDPLEEALNYPAIVKGTVIKVTPRETVGTGMDVVVRRHFNYNAFGVLEVEDFDTWCGVGVQNNGELVPYIPKVGEEALWLVYYANSQADPSLRASSALGWLGLSEFPSWVREKEKYAAAEALATQVQKVVQLPSAERRQALAKLAVEHQQEAIAAWAYELVARFDPKQRLTVRGKVLDRKDTSRDFLRLVLRAEEHFSPPDRLPPERVKAIEALTAEPAETAERPTTQPAE